jgi:WD40 repeat protein
LTTAWAFFSPDGSEFATADAFNIPEEDLYKVRIFDTDDGEQLVTFDGHTNIIYMAVWSPDGTKMASSSFDGNVFIWDALTGDMLLDLVEDEITVDPGAIEWSPDGTRLIGAFDDGDIVIWDTQTGDELIRFSGHAGFIHNFSWSPSGDMVLSAAEDNTARVWDPDTGFELYRYPIYTNIPSFWFPDGERVMVGEIIYPVWNSTQDLIDYARECCVVRELTPEERAKFGLPARED